MSASSLCSNCNATVPGGSPMGLCPRCCLWAIDDEEFNLPDPDPDLDPDLEVPGFEVISKIGSGAFGEVYECLEFEPAVRKVAVKILKSEMMGAAQRLKEEIQILAGLEHSSIARLFSAGELSDRRPYYAMELVEGRSFLWWIQEENPSTEERVEVLTQMASALAHAHSRGVVHRDLKPSNVMVAREGQKWVAKVIDFGVARAVHGVASFGREITLADTWVGTPHYMSPEQIEGSQRVGPAADVYAMGLIIFEALYEEKVLGGLVSGKESWLDIYQARKQWRPPQWPSRVPAHVKSSKDSKLLYWIAVKATSWNESNRYPDAQKLHQELIRWKQREALEATSNSSFYRVKRLLLGSKGALFILIIGTLVTVGFMIGGPIFFNFNEIGTYLGRVDDRAGSDRLLAESRLLLNEERIQDAKSVLKQAIIKWPDNNAARLALGTIKSLTPTAREMAEIELPARANRIWEMNDGRWGVVLEDGRILAIDSEANMEELQVPVPDKRDYWTGRRPISWVAKDSKGGRLDFSNRDASYPVLAPLQYSSSRASVAVSSLRHRVASVDGSKSLKRWDISEIGKNRYEVGIEDCCHWMSYDSDSERILFGSGSDIFSWERGEVPLKASDDDLVRQKGGVKAMLEDDPLLFLFGGFDSRILTHYLGWSEDEIPGDEIVWSVTPSFSSESLAYTEGGKLLKFTGQSGFEEIRVEMHSPTGACFSPDGKLALVWNGQNELCILSLETNSCLYDYRLEHSIHSAGFLDKEGLAIVGTTGGYINTVDLDSGIVVENRIDLQGGRLEPAPILVKTVDDGSRIFAAGQGELKLHQYQIQQGVIEEVAVLKHQFGIERFSLSADGEFLVSVDQITNSERRADDSSLIRIISLRTGEEVTKTFKHSDPVVWAGLSPNNRELISVTVDGGLRRLVLNQENRAEIEPKK